jgi:sulfonate transport system permease protein
MMSWRVRLAVLASQSLSVGLLVWVWQSSSDSAAETFSRPSSVWNALKDWLSDSTLRGDIRTTLEEAAVGFGAALVVAVILGVLLGSSELASRVFSPIVSVLNAAPKIALAPLFLLVFGIGFEAKVYFVAAAVVFIPFYALFTAIRDTDVELLRSTRMLGARSRWQVRDVYLPSTVVAVLGSLRLAVSFAILSAVVAEMISAQAGIGFVIVTAQSNQRIDMVLAGVALVALIAFILDRILVVLERRFTRWQRATR